MSRHLASTCLVSGARQRGVSRDSLRVPVDGLRSSDLPVQTVGAGPEADWLVLGELGKGGMGRVLRARQQILNRDAALKMPLAGPADRRAGAMLLAEASVAAWLDHPGIIPVYAIARTQDGMPFYAMRLMPGTPWAERLGQDGLERDLDVLLAVSNAVAYANARGVLHRDIKPANILVGRFGEVMLNDWGLAAGIVPGTPALPVQPVPVGSPAYFAPEMARPAPERPLGATADVYLLGATLWELLTGEPPHPGTELRALLQSAAENRIMAPPWESGEPHPAEGLPRSSRDALAAIALRAMATAPADRFADASAFAAALRSWRSERSGRDLLDRAREALAEAPSRTGYDACVRAALACEEALRLLPGDADAAQLLVEVRAVWARLALERGDLDLAETQVMAGQPRHAGLLGSIHNARQERAVQLAATARLASVEADLAADRAREWTTVVDCDLAEAPDVLIDELFAFHGQWQRIAQGVAVDGAEPHIIALRRPFRGDVRLTFLAALEGLGDDLSCFLAGADDAAAGLPARARQGYEFKLCWDGRRRSTLFRKRIALWEDAGLGIQERDFHQVCVERQGQHLRWTLDGNLIAETTDTQPLIGGLLGLWSFYDRLIVRRVQVAVLGAPRREDLVDAAERHLALGHIRTASDLLLDVETSLHAGPRLARAREIRAQLSRQSAKRVGEQRCRDAIAAWTGSQDPRLRRDDDDLCLIAARLDAQIAALASDPHIGALEIGPGGADDSSLPLLRGTNLRHLRLPNCAVSDLSPLSGLPLNSLHLGACPVRDLRPLQGMPLHDLTLRDSAVADLQPLRGLPLKRLDLDRTAAQDLRPLAEMHGIHLKVCGLGLGGLEHLAGLRFYKLTASGNRIRDLSPILVPGLRLSKLALDHNHIADLRPLAGVTLIGLDLHYNPIRDLRPLASCQFASLSISATPVSDLGPIAHLSLSTLAIDRTPWRADSVPKCRTLLARGCAIEDASGLAVCEARVIDICENPLRTLGALADVHGLSRLWFWSPGLSADELLRCRDRWRTAEAEHQRRTAEAYLRLQAGDAPGLRDVLQPKRGVATRTLPLPLSCSAGSAERIASQLGLVIPAAEDLKDPGLASCWYRRPDGGLAGPHDSGFNQLALMWP